MMKKGWGKMIIGNAGKQDLREILTLQYLAYQSEAKLLNNYEIPPLKQTIGEMEKEYDTGTILKAIDDAGTVIGSVRAYRKADTVYIGKLMVHPAQRRQGIGTALLQAIEEVCPAKRYELFTSDQSTNNLRLYEKLGYARYKAQKIAPGLRLVYMEKYTKGK